MIDRNKLVEIKDEVMDVAENETFYKKDVIRFARHVFDLLAEVERLRAMVNPITGETSDGYHTFNELYHHRAVLFSVICNARPDIAWKARKHNDGTMYEGDFIVGIQTPDGQAAYHYSADRYWELFRVPILDRAPIWDGYTPTQAIERIGHLRIKNEWEEAYAEQSGVINRLEDEINALRAWAAANPVKSYKDDFFEKFPNAPRDELGYPYTPVGHIYPCKFSAESLETDGIGTSLSLYMASFMKRWDAPLGTWGEKEKA